MGGLSNGLGNGFGLGQLNTGLGLGLHSTELFKARMIDPNKIDGYNTPLFFVNGESVVNTGPDTLITSVVNLSKSGYGLSRNSDPMFKYNFFRNRSGIQLDANDSMYTTTNSYMNNRSEMTVFFVHNIDRTNTYNIMWKVSSTSFDNIGDVTIQGIGGDKIRSTFIGNPTSTSSVYETFSPLVEDNMVLVCAKYRMGQPTFPEQMLYVNGIKNMKPITTTFDTNAGEGFVTNGNPFYFGGNSSFVGGGGLHGSILVLPYWVNDSEQFMIENYFRWYYGFKF
jgi:hypothetical protein